jgi:hypothetical protein
MAKVRNGWLKALQDLGFSPVFLSTEQLARGDVRMTENAVLVLPDVWALSDLEAEEVRRFLGDAGKGNTLLWSGEPGCFDASGRLRDRPVFSSWGLADLPVVGAGSLRSKGQPALWSGDVAAYGAERLKQAADLAFAHWVRKQFPQRPPLEPVDPAARVLIHRLKTSTGPVVYLERNIQYDMSESLQQGGGNDHLEHSVTVELKDHRTPENKSVRVVVEPFQPLRLR